MAPNCRRMMNCWKQATAVAHLLEHVTRPKFPFEPFDICIYPINRYPAMLFLNNGVWSRGGCIHVPAHTSVDSQIWQVRGRPGQPVRPVCPVLVQVGVVLFVETLCNLTWRRGTTFPAYKYKDQGRLRYSQSNQYKIHLLFIPLKP